jgi:hypothetical protein
MSFITNADARQAAQTSVGGVGKKTQTEAFATSADVGDPECLAVYLDGFQATPGQVALI